MPRLVRTNDPSGAQSSKHVHVTGLTEINWDANGTIEVGGWSSDSRLFVVRLAAGNAKSAVDLLE